VACARIHQKHVAKLGDVSQALEFLGVNERNQILGNVDMPPDGIPDGLACIQKPEVDMHIKKLGGRPFSGRRSVFLMSAKAFPLPVTRLFRRRVSL
jgi:hypothetical protein